MALHLQDQPPLQKQLILHPALMDMLSVVVPTTLTCNTDCPPAVLDPFNAFCHQLWDLHIQENYV